MEYDDEQKELFKREEMGAFDPFDGRTGCLLWIGIAAMAIVGLAMASQWGS